MCPKTYAVKLSFISLSIKYMTLKGSFIRLGLCINLLRLEQYLWKSLHDQVQNIIIRGILIEGFFDMMLNEIH